MATLPMPQNRLVSLINMILDGLIKGYGADALYAATVAQEPWLSAPVVGWFWKQFISAAAAESDNVLKKNVDVLVIRFQDQTNVIEYNAIIDNLKKEQANATDKAAHDKALAAAKAAIDQLVNRNKP